MKDAEIDLTEAGWLLAVPVSLAVVILVAGLVLS